MKTAGYPLCIAVLLSIIFFEAMDFYGDIKNKMGNSQSQTLSELSSSEEEPGLQTEQISEEEPADAPQPMVKTFEQVDDSYFDDAVFIGDSRVVGLWEYSELTNATFYASVGMNVYDLFSKDYISMEGSRKKIGLQEALSAHSFKKVYLMVGINELGRDTTEGFQSKYAEVIAQIKELQPDAIIYIQSIMVVTAERSDTDKIFNNTNIGIRNEAIKALADDETVFYLNVNEVFQDEFGNLISDYSGDDTHLLAKYYVIWVDYLKAHAIINE